MSCLSTDVVLIRFFNQTLDSIKYNVAQMVGTMLSINPDARTRMDEDPLSAVGDLMPTLSIIIS
ncbi:hypothetical protein CRYUN_Cryun33cG0110700 [Craigia yunnanensis]